MIVLTEIKLHQSAMRDIIPLRVHAVIIKKEQIKRGDEREEATSHLL